MDGPQAIHLFHAGIAHPGKAHLACLDQVGNGAPGFFNILIRDGPVDLVKVDDIDIQSTQAGLTLGADAVRFEALSDVGAAFLPDQATLGGDDHLVAPALDGLADHLFRTPQAIGCRGIDPVQTHFDAPAKGGDGLGVVLGSPTPLPAPAADGPRTQPNGGQIQVRISQFALLHGFTPSKYPGVCPSRWPNARVGHPLSHLGLPGIGEP